MKVEGMKRASLTEKLQAKNAEVAKAAAYAPPWSSRNGQDARWDEPLSVFLNRGKVGVPETLCGVVSTERAQIKAQLNALNKQRRQLREAVSFDREGNVEKSVDIDDSIGWGLLGLLLLVLGNVILHVTTLIYMVDLLKKTPMIGG
ncbi:hypothetical protein Dimus_033189 [Dionaea muscipula]